MLMSMYVIYGIRIRTVSQSVITRIRIRTRT